MTNLYITLPLLAFLLCAYVYHSHFNSVRKSLVFTGITCLLYIEISTEILSIFNAINKTSIIFVWLFALIILCIQTCIVKTKRIKFIINYKYLVYILIIVFCLVLTLTVALVAPPNTWDGMTYHMSRIVHWIDNNSISYYYTQIPRQNYMPPLCEEAIMHLQILTQSDRFANIVAWTFYLLTIIQISLVVSELRIGAQWEYFSASLAATLPMAIFQSTGCKNDTTISFIVLFFIYSLILLRKKWTITYLSLAGISMGLGLYCKGTFLVIGGSCGLSFVIVEFIPRIRKSSIVNFSKYTFALIFIGFFISSPYWIREYKTNFTGIKFEASIQNNEDKGISGITSNIIRSAAVHLSLPSNNWNKRVYTVVKILLNKHFDDPRTTYPNYNYSTYYWPHEDHAGNPIHICIIFLSLLILLINYKNLNSNRSMLILSLIFSILLFNFTLKWQPWVSRLHTPLFMLGIPLSTLALSNLQNQFRLTIKYIPYIILFFSSISAIPALFFNYSRPLLSNKSQNIFKIDRHLMYFINRPEILHDYLEIDRILRSSKVENISIGLFCGYDDWEYPLLVLSNSEVGRKYSSYKIHQIDLKQPDRIIIGLGVIGKSIENNPNINVIYKGSYANLYTLK